MRTNNQIRSEVRALIKEVGECCGCHSTAEQQADKVVALLEEVWQQDHAANLCACEGMTTCRGIDHG